jgi:hypothetical protein|tara:strand:- start:1845 stop:3056 length:1212 start_codon:yes stop_codon:yes gene_type:complete
MKITDSQKPSPAGFQTVSFEGIGLSCEMIEPVDLESDRDWEQIVSGLKPWGEVPDPGKIRVSSLSEDERGPIAILEGDKDWVAEFLPWGSDGLIRMRAVAPSSITQAPCGGYRWNGADIVLIRELCSDDYDINIQISESLNSGDSELAKKLLWGCGDLLGRHHREVESTRTTPPDPRRWNKRMQGLEEKLRSQSIWRAPHSRDAECMLSIGDLRLSDFSEGSIKIGRPRLSDALLTSECEFPAIRDLSSLIHDLSRLHFQNSCDIDIVELRSSLIDGWKHSAPEKWCSDSVFYSHRGGLAIWEYEQCLLDVVEAVSHQSGAPQPATAIIGYVTPYQKKMFNNRVLGAFSMMAGFFGLASLVNTFPPSQDEIPLPLFSLLLSFLLLRYYRSLAPPPELPFTRFA